MACKVIDVSINGDVDGKIKGILKQITKGVINGKQKLPLFVSYVNSGKILSYIKDNYEQYKDIKSLNDIPDENLKDVLKNSLNTYYKNNHLTVKDNVILKENEDDSLKFSSNGARRVAVDYCAVHVLKTYGKRFVSDQETNSTGVITELKNHILKKIYANYESIISELQKEYNRVRNNEERNKIDNLKATLISLKNQFNDLNTQYNNLLDEYEESEEVNDEIEDKLDKLEETKRQIKNQYTITLLNALTEYGNNIEKNTVTLYNLINTNNVEFIKSIINSPKIYSLRHEISKETNDQQLEDDDAIDIENVEIPENNDIDETAKSWVNALYSSFDKNYGAKIKLYFNTLPLLRTEGELDNDIYDYDTDNEMGLETYMDANYILAVLNIKTNTSSVQSFIKSVQELSSKNPMYYGLMQLVNDMRKDVYFANNVLYEINNPRIDKAIATVTTNGFEFKYSNRASNYEVFYTNRLINSLKSTFREFYNIEDENYFKEFRDSSKQIELLSKVNKIEIKNKYDEEILKAKTKFIKTLKNFFPTISENSIEDFINNGNNLENLKILSDKINLLYKQINEFIAQDDEITEDYLKKLSTWKSDQMLLMTVPDIGFQSNLKATPKPVKDYSKLNIEVLYAPCIELSKLFVEYDIAKFDLNSANAENNLSTDLMKNSYITNLLRQIEFSKDSEEQTGLIALKEFISQSNYYENSTMFFGVRDANGNVIRDGLFTRNGDGTISVNANAKNMIHFLLFDGIKNEVSGDGVMYNGLNKNDYLITQIKAFTNPTKTKITVGDEFDKIAGYFLRTPSDAPRNYIIQTFKYSLKGVFEKSKTQVNTQNYTDFVNKNKSEIYWALYNNLFGELNNFISQLNSVLEQDKNGYWVPKNDTKNLIDKVHYGKGNSIFANNELTGNIFKFFKLFETNGFNVDKVIKDTFLLYGGENESSLFSYDINGNAYLNTNHQLIKFDEVNNKLALKVNNDVKIKLINILNDWLNNYNIEINNVYNQFKSALDQNNINKSDFEEWSLNATVANMSFDDILEGDVRQYIPNNKPWDARQVLKRAKEIQAGGKQYSAYNFNDGLDSGVRTLLDDNNNPIAFTDNNGKIFGREGFREKSEDGSGLKENQPIYIRNGFKAITVKNNEKSFEVQKDKILKELEKEFIKTYTPEVAHQLALDIALGYTKPTAVDDAQSWITFEEFIRRRVADGTIDEYRDLIEQILDVRNGKKKLNQIDLKGIAKRIQVQKNFYFDKVYSKETGIYYNRQIKNAEFVLIPELLGDNSSELKKLYNFMIENGIDQINTEETSKAGKKNVVEIWNGKGQLKENLQDIVQNDIIEDYYYRFLYKQQDVPQHMQDAKNKAGVQIIKKIIDNTPTELKDLVDKFFDLYTTNIEESAETFLTNMGWMIDANGEIINKDGSKELNFEEFHQRFIDEAMRLGMNSNFIESITPDKNGKTKIPNFMNINSVKAESIAQALFNSIVTRQTLPGWHAAQITSVGHHIADENGNMRELRYHPAAYKLKEEFENDKSLKNKIEENEFKSLDKDLKDKYELFNESYCEVLIPRWSKLIPEGYDISKLEKEGIDLQIAYRIPTEGKQSISKIKVVGLLNEAYGSTIVVPDEWVVQTGSDFDVDSVYAISHKLYTKKGEVKRVKFDDDSSLEATKIRYINKITHIINQKVSRNNFDTDVEKEEIKKLKEKLDKLKKDLVREPRKAIEKEFYKALDSLRKVNKQLSDNIFEKYTSSEDKIEAFKEILDIINNNEKYKENAKGIINIIEYGLDLDFTNRDIETDTYKSYLSDLKKYPNHPIASKYIEAFDKYFDEIVKLAEVSKLYTFNEFSKLNIVKQNSRDQRSSRILDIMMEIMDHQSSKEENYSRSNSEAIVDAIENVDKLTSAVKGSTSAYNPFNQIQFMEDAMGGATLKAFSVTRDTFCSICSKVKAKLSDNNAIYVRYDLSKFDESIISTEYGDDIVDKTKEYIIVKHNKLGWSKNNRNVKGKLITVYGSQTTAHILDAVKNGTIYNENTYTFAAFKTLIDLGIDYNTAVAFLAQPAITKILNVQKTKESIYSAENVNIIKQSLINLYNEISKEDQLDRYISYDKLTAKLRNHKDLNRAFVDLFGITIYDALNKEAGINIVLDGEQLENRLKKSINGESIENIAYDLGITIFFNKLKKVSDSIGNLARCVTSDKFGAKQTIRATRNIIKDIAKYSNPENETGSTVIVDTNTPFLNVIYPFVKEIIVDKNGEEHEVSKLDVSRSLYPSLAAFLKYSTQLSYAVNTQLFDTEKLYISEDGARVFGMPIVIEDAEKILGKTFNDSEYKEFKQYVIASIFKEIPILNEPIKLIKKGNTFKIEIDNYINDPDSNENEYKISEIYRIFGYEETESADLKIENKNNPTEEEISKFNKLTPAQKVFWMQQNLEGESLFTKLRVNLFNDYEYKNFGYSSQTIKFEDLSSDIEDFFKEFNNIWFNSNPLIKLTAIDLVKYAFIAEGNKFKKGNISKIIPNHIIYNSLEDDGLNIAEAATELFMDKCDPANSKKITELFVRSHPEIVKTINLPNVNKEKNNVRVIFNRLNVNNGIIAIDNNEANQKLINKLISTDVVPRYININRQMPNGKYKTTLYKVKYIFDEDGNIISLYLLPENKLEKNEHGTYNGISVNHLNNEFAPIEYYESVVDYQMTHLPIDILVKQISTSENTEFKEFYTKTVLNNRTFRTPVKINSSNPHLIENDSKLENDIESAKAKKFKKDIITELEHNISLPVENRSQYFYIHNDSSNIGTAFPFNETSIQEIEIDGNVRTFAITKVKNMRILASLRGSNKKRMSTPEKRIVDLLKETAIKMPTLYKIKEVILEEAVQDLNNRIKEEEKILSEENEKYAISSLIDDTIDETNIRKESDGFLKDIYNIIAQDAAEGNETAFSFKQAIQALNVNWTDNVSRRQNNVSLYKIYADYIQYKANTLLNKINNFYTENGEEYSIDDENLYKYLRESPETFVLLNKLLLDAKTFGNRFFDIFNINFEYEDEATKINIEKIKNSILQVRNNAKLKQAFTLMFNNYLANELSQNPNVKQGLIDVTTAFKDTDWFDTQISDIGFVDNKQVQLVVKLVNRILDKSTRVNAPQAIDKFTKEYDSIMNMSGEYNQAKIIFNDGRLILPYTEKFISDRDEHLSKLAQLRIDKGETSIEFIKAKLEYDKWKLDNLEQPLIREYYEKDIEIREKVLNQIPELFIKYKELTDKLYKDTRPIHTLSNTEKLERQKLVDTINSLSSELDELGEYKTGKEFEDAKALKEYISDNKKLQNTYYKYEGSVEFNNTLQKYLKVIEKYEKDHPTQTISERLIDSNYREAYEWLKSNTVYKVDEATQTKISDAFALLRKEKSANNRIKQIIKNANAYDNYGNFDPRKLSHSELAEIKSIYESEYEDYDEDGSTKNRLIKDIPKRERVDLTDKAKKILSTIFVEDPKRTKIIERINEILNKIVKEDGRIRSKDIFEKLSFKDQNLLATLYTQLASIPSGVAPEEINTIKQMFVSKINEEAFNEELEYYEKHIKGTSINNEVIWKSIFVAQTKDGDFKINKKTKKFSPNKNIYGYSLPQDKIIDKDKTEARKIIKESVEYIPTDYYFDAAMKAQREGTYIEWYKANHYYNPYTKRIEPLRVWTKMHIKESQYVKPEYSYSPTFENNYRVVKDNEYKNKNYKQDSVNYNETNGHYNNMTHLSDKEKAMVNLLRKTLNKYAITKKSKQFINKGFLPRQYKANIDSKWYLKQVLGGLGLEFRHTGETRYRKELQYDSDNYDSDPMLEFLKLNGTQDFLPLPQESDYTTEEYKKAVEEIKEKNKEIEAENLKLESDVLNKNWKEVFKQFIKVGEENIARSQIKDPIYLLLEDLKDREAIEVGNKSDRVIFNRSRSTDQTNVASGVKQENTYKIVENWARRVIYKEFKKDSKLKPFADFAQNLTSAKYMILNVTGGIKNIGTGFANILGESFATEYFTNEELVKACGRYLANIHHILGDMYKETSTNDVAAILKFFEIVNFDEILEKRTNESIEDYAKRTRDMLYGLQSGGEHYMQNATLLAMLKSHRMYEDSEGKSVLGSYTDYIWNIETLAVQELIKDNEQLTTAYRRFLREIRNDLNKQKHYDRFKSDFNRNFIESLNDINLSKKYIEIKKNKMKNAKEEFEKLPILEDLIRIENGRVVVNENDKLTFDMLMEFNNKVKYVNKQIHGVYDKIGAAKIESEWWGGLVMQYHKHLYPGIMKRWRVNGYYNEQTQSTQVGSYISLYRFLSLEFKKSFAENNTEGVAVINSIKNIISATINTVMNIRVNWDMMSEWEKRNIMRVKGDLAGIIGSLLLATAIYAFSDDEDEEESNVVATALYIADSLLGESQLYTPWGLYTEGKTQWSNPIAAGSSVKDLMKGLELLTAMLFDDDFDPEYKTGRYAGENKFFVLLYKNTPIWRIWKRLTSMTKSNNYFRLNDNAWNMRTAKDIANWITGKENTK